ncbi:3-oxoacyl-ACP reductase family protein [Streptomyces sp. IBSBF 3136]|uniref:3-oxoacyl-ACP reductase family protein n=1 Tax=Streptomyces sp. IBSBF 3136 TaxID=2903524 RepID=UPI002FDC1310
MTARLTGKSALVTGGSRGIGAGIVRRLAEEGAYVVFTYVRGEAAAQALTREVSAAGGRAVAVQADSGDPEAIRTAVADTVRMSGRVDILVNNASYTGSAPIASFSVEEFDRMMAVNLRGAFVAVQEAVRHMGDGGRIINTGSIFADRTPSVADAGTFVYQMAKAGIAGFTRGIARELGPRGITANTIQPGVIKTDALGEESEKLMLSLTPVGRVGSPADIAGAVAYLASAESGFVNGVTFNIDGGFAV